jgi:hypothetical protein
MEKEETETIKKEKELKLTESKNIIDQFEFFEYFFVLQRRKIFLVGDVVYHV